MRMSIATLAGPPGGVLVASADAGFRRHVAHTLHSDRWPVQEALGGADALGKLESGSCHLLVLALTILLMIKGAGALSFDRLLGRQRESQQAHGKQLAYQR